MPRYSLNQRTAARECCRNLSTHLKNTTFWKQAKVISSPSFQFVRKKSHNYKVSTVAWSRDKDEPRKLTTTGAMAVYACSLEPAQLNIAA